MKSSVKKFQPELKTALVALPVFLALLALGFWQIERMAWKHDLLQRVEERSQGEARALPADFSDSNAWEYTYVKVRGNFLHDKELHLAARVRKGVQGFHIVTPFRLEDGHVLLVNRGWVPAEKRDAASRAEGQVQVVTEISGVLRVPYRSGLFTPHNNAEKNYWFSFPLAEVAAATGLTLLPPLLELNGPEPAGGFPAPLPRDIELLNDHLEYALTWFGLAVALLVVYVAYHWRPVLPRQPADAADGGKV